MDKQKKYFGIIGFCVALALLIFGAYQLIMPKVKEIETLEGTITEKQEMLSKKENELKIVQAKIKKIKDSIITSQKKIYSPVEAELGEDTLFFTLYSDVIEMVNSNSIKIKSLDYVYNPETDAFVKFGKDVYFVCDVNMDLVSNYVNLGKLVQDLYQYPYYIKINELDVKPYDKDKTILLSKLSLRLYAHTAPDDTEDIKSLPGEEKVLDGATTNLPQ